jgi:hypothetical protein
MKYLRLRFGGNFFTTETQSSQRISFFVEPGDDGSTKGSALRAARQPGERSEAIAGPGPSTGHNKLERR